MIIFYTISYQLYNWKTVRDISMKLGTHMRLLLLAYLWSYFPLIIFHTFVCPLYYSKTVRDISNETWYTYKAQSDDVSCLKTITLACVFLELFPFDYFPYNFMSALNLKNG